MLSFSRLVTLASVSAALFLSTSGLVEAGSRVHKLQSQLEQQRALKRVESKVEHVIEQIDQLERELIDEDETTDDSVVESESLSSSVVAPAEASTESEFESYIACGSVRAAQKSLTAKALTSAYFIEVRFMGGLTESQKNAFKSAADRWTTAIVGDLPNVNINGEVIDDLVIEASGTNIDGPGRILGQAGPTYLRPGSMLPAKGRMQFDSADLSSMERIGTLQDVITHEMGHVIGVGTIWRQKGLVTGAGTTNPRFTGKAASAEWGALVASGTSTSVPVENTGGQGTRDSHWRESILRKELMTGYISDPNNPISRVTIGSLQDIGYTVDFNAAQPYKATSGGSLRSAASLNVGGHTEAIIPTVLPVESLDL